jgi:hypothetical protein
MNEQIAEIHQNVIEDFYEQIRAAMDEIDFNSPAITANTILEEADNNPALLQPHIIEHTIKTRILQQLNDLALENGTNSIATFFQPWWPNIHIYPVPPVAPAPGTAPAGAPAGAPAPPVGGTRRQRKHKRRHHKTKRTKHRK